MASPPWRPATWRRLALALAATVIEVLLVYTLVVVGVRSTSAGPDERGAYAEGTFGWFMQAVVTLGIAVALPWLWRHVRRPDHEAAWLAGERPPDDGLRPPHRSLSGEDDPPTRW